MALRLLAAALSIATAVRVAPPQKNKCGCLIWKDVYQKGLVKCGHGREFHPWTGRSWLTAAEAETFYEDKGEEVCQGYLQRLEDNICINSKFNDEKAGKWCYTESGCNELNGGEVMQDYSVAWKKCTEEEGHFKEPENELPLPVNYLLWGYNKAHVINPKGPAARFVFTTNGDWSFQEVHGCFCSPTSDKKERTGKEKQIWDDCKKIQDQKKTVLFGQYSKGKPPFIMVHNGTEVYDFNHPREAFVAKANCPAGQKWIRYIFGNKSSIETWKYDWPGLQGWPFKIES